MGTTDLRHPVTVLSWRAAERIGPCDARCAPPTGTGPTGTGPAGRRTRWATTRQRLRHRLLQLWRFGVLEAVCCAFPAGVFAGLAVTRVVPLPVARYDALLVWCLLLTVGFWLLGLETWRELVVIAGFHLVGLALELYKVRMGSWSYPGDAVLAVGGVPLFSGFMYAAVGSYICQAWRRMHLRLTGYRPRATALVAAAVYVNFFTHHHLPDVRLPLAALLVVVAWPCRVHFTVGAHRYRMPLALSFVLIGTFLWIAENAATWLSAWRYPDQLHVWQVVHAEKLGSWSLLVSVSFVLVAALHALDGKLHEDAPGPPRPGRPGVDGAAGPAQEDDGTT